MQAREGEEQQHMCLQTQSMSLPGQEEGGRVARVMRSTACRSTRDTACYTKRRFCLLLHCSPPQQPRDAPQLMRPNTASLSSAIPCTFLCYLPPPLQRHPSSTLAKAITWSFTVPTLTGIYLRPWIHSWKTQKASQVLLSSSIKICLH